MTISSNYTQNPNGSVTITITAIIDSNNQLIKVLNYPNKDKIITRLNILSALVLEKQAKLDSLQRELDLLSTEQTVLYSL